jgi:hypothetical protein
MRSTRKFLLTIVSANGKPSSKRLITLLAFILMGIGFVSNLFFDLKIDQFIYESMQWIVIGGLGFTASELFGNKKALKDNQEGGGPDVTVRGEPNTDVCPTCGNTTH